MRGERMGASRRLNIGNCAVRPALSLGGKLFVNLLTMRNGQIWVGGNYWNQPLPALLQFVVVSFFLIGFGLWWLMRNWRWWLQVISRWSVCGDVLA